MSFATHLRSGEISYRPVSGQANTYEITVTTYTNASAGIIADLNSLSISFGDGTKSTTIYRNNGLAGYNNSIPAQYCNHLGELVTSSIRKNIYITTHTFSGTGSFIISIAPSARNLGIINMPSGNLAMYVEAMLTIGPSLKPMSSPKLSLPPWGDGCIDAIYKINPGAIDPDGDVLAFQLIKCKTTGGKDISGYKYPQELDATGRTTFLMNPRTGEIIWDKPTIQGEYNISFKIEKWRNGVLIGYVTRDMQITIAPCPNKPPILNPVPDTCIEVGKTLVLKITGSDPDLDTLTFTTTGAPYDLATSPATYTPDVTAIGYTSGTFTWNTTYAHIQKNPYQVYYKVVDSHEGSHLTDYTSNFISIIAPPVQNVSASIYKKGFNIKWDQSLSQQVTGYNIWRKTDPPTQFADKCTQGVPSNLGFSLIGTVNSATTLSYIDSNDGKGLIAGSNYCYIVTATFADGAESHPSEPVCVPLMIPFINVLKDTISACLWNTINIDTTVLKFENADPLTKYTWSASPEIKLSDSDKPLLTATLNNSGFYFIKLKATSGLCTDSAKIIIQVSAIPDAKITLNDVGGNPDSVFYYNKTPNIIGAVWKLPDGTQSTDKDSVLVRYSVNGYYRVYLTVYNALGCPDTTSILHRVALKGLFVPNAFEPDSPYTDINTFKPAAIGLQSYHIGIWDLWGNLIWESINLDAATCPAEGWNGCDKKGRKLPAQVYIWRIKATFIDDTPWLGKKDNFGKYHTEGTLTLIR